MRRLGYARVSSVEQALDSHALEQQIERLKLAGATEVYVDVESGYKNRKRLELEKVMQMVKNQECDEVIITRLDRLSRKGIQSFMIFDEFVQCGVILRALDEPFDLTTSVGKMTAGLLAVFAQHHSDQKSEAVKHGWQHLRNREVAMQPPFGYCKLGDRFALDHTPFLCRLDTQQELSKASIAQEIIEAFFDTQTLRSCLRCINERYGIQTFAHHHKSGGLYARGLFRFSVGGLSKWITNPVLQGHVCYKRRDKGKWQSQEKWDIRYNTHPDQALLSSQQMNEIEEILKHNRDRRGYGCTAQKYPLSGLVFCGECRSSCYSLKGNRGKTPGYNHYFQCKNWRVRSCSQKQVVRMEAIESALITALIQKSNEIATYADTAHTSAEPQELKELRRRLEGLSQLGYDPDIEDAKAKLQRRINEFIRGMGERQQESSSSASMLKSFPDPMYWQTLPDEEKRIIYRALVDKVVVGNGLVKEVILKF
jgi:site-specific DNA recombinase